jgi:hypothetical protein
VTYDISQAVRDEDGKFSGTLVALDGDLHYVDGWDGPNKAYCHDLGLLRGYHKEFSEADFSPRLEAGYYNLPTGLHWLSMVPMRQYKAGLNENNVIKRAVNPAHLGAQGGVNCATILHAYNHCGVYPCTKEELAIERRDGVALTERYALHHTAIGHKLLVCDCEHVVGLLTTEGLRVEEGIDVTLPTYVEYEYASAERLTELFATAQDATVAAAL